jgi:hypothetical protein
VVIGLDSDTTDALLWGMSRVPIRHRRSRPKPGRRALELLATSRDGCTEAIMIAHGFTVPQMVELSVPASPPHIPSAWLPVASGARSPM